MRAAKLRARRVGGRDSRSASKRSSARSGAASGLYRGSASSRWKGESIAWRSHGVGGSAPAEESEEDDEESSSVAESADHTSVDGDSVMEEDSGVHVVNGIAH